MTRVLGEWLLTPERVALHLPTVTAVAADLHLGYDEARRRRGEAVPVRPLDEQLAPLGRALARHGCRRLVIAGDLLEDGRCLEALAELRDWLRAAKVELVGAVPGNHDAGFSATSEADFPVCADGVRLGDWQVVHGDGELPEGPLVQGHEHPWFRWRGRLSAPCYLVADARLVLPAYSDDAAGVNVRGERRWRDFRCLVIAGDEVLDFGVLGSLGRRGARQ
jgi:putative SbcD/Mre11-related phosphoesterase